MEEEYLLVLLRKEVHRVHLEFSWYKKLYSNSSNEVQELLKSTAHNFFIELREILADRCILNISRLTDPFEQRNFRNLSLFLLKELAEKYNWKSLNEIEKYLEEIKSITSRVRDKRRKLTAHKDLDEMENPTLLYTISIDEFEDIFTKIGNLMNIYNKEIKGFEWNWYPESPGGIDSLLYFLKLGYKFESIKDND